ncbi:hypothetical protein L4D09_03300 [Photobacterium makurazakiensis]|uniref:hypothetical protein n=1 Tax=Photobacterium makurazakiensis TaxID=2910234 RepID=UPI003D0BCE3D
MIFVKTKFQVWGALISTVLITGSAAKAMVDLADDDYLRMFCVELAIFQQAITLQPGESHQQIMTIS